MRWRTSNGRGPAHALTPICSPMNRSYDPKTPVCEEVVRGKRAVRGTKPAISAWPVEQCRHIGRSLMISEAGRSQVCVVALLLVAALSLASCSSSQQSGGVAVPRSAIPRLAVLASQFAKGNGDPKPRWAAVEVTVPRGVEVSADTAPNGTMAYLVVMRGHFTAFMAPPHTAAPTGRYLFIIIGPRTFRLRSWGLGNKLPSAWSANRASLTHLHLRSPGHQAGCRVVVTPNSVWCGRCLEPDIPSPEGGGNE